MPTSKTTRGKTKKKRTGKTVKGEQVKGEKKGKRQTGKKTKQIPEIPRETVKEARVQIESALMRLPWESPQDRERVKALIARIRDIPTELGFTPEQMKLAKEYGADRIWWVDTSQKDKRRKDVLKRQIEFVDHYMAVGAKIVLAVEAMRRAHGGAPVIHPSTVSIWKKSYPDFRQALFACMVRDYEITVQALRKGVLKGNATLIIFDAVNKSLQIQQELKRAGTDEQMKAFVESLPFYQHIQTLRHEGGEDFGKNAAIQPVDVLEILKDLDIPEEIKQKIQDEIDDRQFPGRGFKKNES